ncbi:hypothetical protein EDB85DRAFT_2155395 [Lactarius pseudohatsudake]|nr:hypothetical protein EDB85DRAFT_2155395 [Lactarius pseudohatsudake]
MATSKEIKTSIWREVDDITLVHTLADQKSSGGWGDNNPKKSAWTACESALIGSEKCSGGVKKSASAIKNRWQKLKQEYETVKELRNVSGFGWDPVKHCVIAEHTVWQEYIKKNPKAKPFCNKGFPLFDEIGDLIDRTRATGQFAFRGGQSPSPSHTRATTPTSPLFDPVIDPSLMWESWDNGLTDGEGNTQDNDDPNAERRRTKSSAASLGRTSVDGAAETLTGALADVAKNMSLGSASDANTLVRALTGVVNAIQPPTPSATSSATNICTAAVNIIKDEEGFSDNDLTCTANCIIASAELAGTYIAIRSRGARKALIQGAMEKLQGLK